MRTNELVFVCVSVYIYVCTFKAVKVVVIPFNSFSILNYNRPSISMVGHCLGQSYSQYTMCQELFQRGKKYLRQETSYFCQTACSLLTKNKGGSQVTPLPP